MYIYCCKSKYEMDGPDLFPINAPEIIKVLFPLNNCDDLKNSTRKHTF